MDNPPEAVKAMARRIVAGCAMKAAQRDQVLRGDWDDYPAVRSAITAIMDTSELCAKWLDSVENETSAHFIREGAHLEEAIDGATDAARQALSNPTDAVKPLKEVER